MPRGRPTKPTHLKLLDGDDKKNPGRINTDEPVPGDVEIKPPWPLSMTGQVVWDRLAPDRIAKKVLTAWDVDAFAVFCESIALVIAKAPDAHKPWAPIPGAASPLSELKTAVTLANQLGSKFGWTPSDRARLISGEVKGATGEDLLSG